jgi:hypothetical protein
MCRTIHFRLNGQPAPLRAVDRACEGWLTPELFFGR